MVESCLPLPGEQERDWVLWVELWLRAVRHPELRPTAAKLYANMHDWFREAIEEGDFGPVDAGAIADRTLALIDGFGVRALLGDPAMPLERAREEVWHALAGDLGLHDRCPQQLGSLNRRSDNPPMSPRPTTGHVRRPAILKAAAEVIAERGVIGTRIADVAERADTSAPGVLYWFATKDELLTEALAFADDHFYAELNDELARLDGARGAAGADRRAVARRGRRRGRAVDGAVGARAARPARSAPRASGSTPAGAMRSPTSCARGRRPASSLPVDPEEFALTLGALMDGFAIQLALHDPAVTPERVREHCMALVEERLGLEGVPDAI